MGFCKIVITRNISKNRLCASLNISLVSGETVQHGPTHKLVSIAESSKTHCHNVHCLHVCAKEVLTIVHVSIGIQNVKIKTSIIRAHNRAGIVLVRNCGEIRGNLCKRLNRDTMKSNRITVILTLILHKAITANQCDTKWGICNL